MRHSQNTKSWAQYAAISAAFFFATNAAYAQTGYMQKTISVPHRDEAIKLDIYFPANDSTETTKHGKNAVFTGIEIIKNAESKTGKYPVVLFSHGSGGNGINTGWIGKAIAESGMIFIAPNHPGTTSRDSHPEDTVKTWERPQDITSIIDQLPKLFAGEMQTDQTKIGTLGFSLGGYSVLALAGAKVEKQAFIEHCNKALGVGLNECGWLTKDGLDLNTIDQTRFEQSHIDPRISATISVDPGLAQAFNMQSLNAIKTPIKIINLGSQDKLYDGVNGKLVAHEIPSAQYHQIEEAFHFSFLGTCTPQGAQILVEEQDDPICNEPNGGERSEIHRELSAQITDFFANHLTAN